MHGVYCKHDYASSKFQGSIGVWGYSTPNIYLFGTVSEYQWCSSRLYLSGNCTPPANSFNFPPASNSKVWPVYVLTENFDRVLSLIIELCMRKLRIAFCKTPIRWTFMVRLYKKSIYFFPHIPFLLCYYALSRFNHKNAILR